MKQLIIIILGIILITGCSQKKEEPDLMPDLTPINYYENRLIDSSFLSIPDPNRYFFISYLFGTYESPPGYGDMVFSCRQYPSRNKIDSMIFTSLPLKRKCYQPLVILSMHEFSNKNDYDAYNRGRGRKNKFSRKVHENCQ